MGARSATVGAEVSANLARLIADILTRYRDVRTTTRNQALAALERGDDLVTLEIPIQDGMPDALVEWLTLLDEADRLSAEQELLLVPARDEVRRLRRWYVTEVVDRLGVSGPASTEAGRPPGG